MSEIKPKYALVTGASSGIGYQYSRVLAEKGYGLVMVSNQEEELKTTAAQIRTDYSVDVVELCINLGTVDSAKEVYAFCKARELEVEMLVNNAGVYHDRDFLDDSPEFNSLILILHVHTPAMLEYYFGQEMLARHKGYIINMSSVTSNFGIQRQATYAATKGFLSRFSRSTHIELKEKGVYVTCVRPGAVATTLYNLKPSAVKTGLALGYIISPEKLARKGVRAVLHGRARITPGFSTKLLQVLVALIPTCALRLVRKLKIF